MTLHADITFNSGVSLKNWKPIVLAAMYHFAKFDQGLPSQTITLEANVAENQNDFL